jgi:hypothetical protein
MAFALQIKQNLRPENPCPGYPVRSLPCEATIFNAFANAQPNLFCFIFARSLER